MVEYQQTKDISNIISTIYSKTKQLKEYYSYLKKEILDNRIVCFAKEQYSQKSRFLIELEQEWYQFEPINLMRDLKENKNQTSWITADINFSTIQNQELLIYLLKIENNAIQSYQEINKKANQLPIELLRVIESQLDEIQYTTNTIKSLEDLPTC